MCKQLPGHLFLWKSLYNYLDVFVLALRHHPEHVDPGAVAAQVDMEARGTRRHLVLLYPAAVHRIDLQLRSNLQRRRAQRQQSVARVRIGHQRAAGRSSKAPAQERRNAQIQRPRDRIDTVDPHIKPARSVGDAVAGPGVGTGAANGFR